ncbi:DUF4085 family protein [Ureibacillus composti]|nr:DUF4085 family protein [Ureibacillus composti]
MWNLSKEVKEKFRKCNLLPIPESEEDWEYALREAKVEGEDLIGRLKEELEEVKAELLQVLPNRFIPYIENGSLNQPTLPETVRVDYLKWNSESNREFELILEAAYEHTKEAVTYLSNPVQEVFAESLHDATIARIDRVGNNLHLYINTDGGFSTKSYIHLIFQKITSENADEPVQVGQCLVYDELQKTEKGFAFRVLFECPEAEWTIEMEKIDAAYYYRPVDYAKLHDERQIESTSFTDYIAKLNPNHRYWLITPDLICTIKNISEGTIILENGQLVIGKSDLVVSVGNKSFTYDFNEFNPIYFIYTDVYEDPYAQFSTPVPTEDLEEAILGEDLELQVRAWNTMYANPNELALIINRILWKLEIREDNELMISVFTSHFYQEGILTEKVVDKYRHLIN